MQAVVGRNLDSLDSYRIETVARPEPGPGEVRIRVVSAGIGYVDSLLCTGRYQIKPPTPYIPGCELAGVIDAIGEQVSGLEVGQRVAASPFGGAFAEYAVARANSVVPLPRHMDFELGAAFWIDHTTAFYALRDRANLSAGESVLVLGAAGGLGQAGIQIARLLGASVIAAASTPAKREAALAAGASLAVDYTQPDWGDTLKRMTDGRGVDVVFDPVGGATFETAFRRLAWGGRHLVLGFTGGSIPALPANLALLKGASLVGVDVRQFASVYSPEGATALRRELAGHIDEGRLRPRIGVRYPFERFHEALESSADRNRIGKAVLTVAQE
ncbi:NADPH:quinone oxidoreductase family protein [Pseudomonas sp. Milli4]|uniref:NADPH:quinone oxidoreductase family protein n=2 Tax=Pseudomonas schmalbachii TaxID=2816993 RepID=A0ABS3TQ17_9PSED|nr:NADPH:quinone oxidoreductase family protein [Pseudomonas schmalbachii]